MTDTFWNIKEQERQREKLLQDKIRSYESAIQLARRAEAIHNAPGFSDFLRAIEDVRGVAVRTLSHGTLNANEIWEQRGRVQALGDILALLGNRQSIEMLESQRAILQNALEQELKRRPKPKEKS